MPGPSTIATLRSSVGRIFPWLLSRVACYGWLELSRTADALPSRHCPWAIALVIVRGCLLFGTISHPGFLRWEESASSPESRAYLLSPNAHGLPRHATHFHSHPDLLPLVGPGQLPDLCRHRHRSRSPPLPGLLHHHGVIPASPPSSMTRATDGRREELAHWP
jgi:hypothetical protein